MNNNVYEIRGMIFYRPNFDKSSENSETYPIIKTTQGTRETNKSRGTRILGDYKAFGV